LLSKKTQDYQLHWPEFFWVAFKGNGIQLCHTGKFEG
jgi:hypothetical protein